MNRDARIVAVAALVTVLLTGCGDTSTNGLEDKSAAQIQEEAAAAIKGAKGVQVIGTSITDGTPAQVAGGVAITAGDAVESPVPQPGGA